MSEWIEITNRDDIGLSDDKKTLDVCFEQNQFGNRWIEIPIEFVLDELKDLLSQ